MSDSTTPQVLGFYSFYRVPQSCQDSKTLPPCFLEKAGNVFAAHFDRLQHHARSGFLLLLRNSSNLSRILPPHLFERNRESIHWTFRATPPPFKSWAPTPPVTPASTCRFEAGPPWPRSSFIPNHKLCLFLDLNVGRWDLSLQHWTCQFEARPSAQLHS